MKPLHNLIWNTCRNIATSSGKKIAGLRDLFDPQDPHCTLTTRAEKLELLSHLKKECGCTIDDIFQAYYTHYNSMDHYEEVLVDSLLGLSRLTPFTHREKSLTTGVFPALEAAFENFSDEEGDSGQLLLHSLQRTLSFVLFDTQCAQEPLIRYLSETLWIMTASGYIFGQDRPLFLAYTALFAKYLDDNLSRLLADAREGKEDPLYTHFGE